MKTPQKTVRGYHFTRPTLRDGSPIPRTGRWLKHVGPVVPCESGLHCSEHPFDALHFAPGNWLHLVELRGDLQSHGSPVDKWVGRERRIIASLDVHDLLWHFARECALSVAHLWDAPDVVLEYLVTGDEEKRASARDSAWASGAWDSAWASARDSAWDSAWASGAWDSAWASARDSAWDSAWASGAWDSAWASALASAWDSARASGAWASARASGAWASARASARDAHRESFKTLIKEAFAEEMA